MHFEKSLKRAIYTPWKDHYIDYPRLKSLLHDEGSDSESVSGRSVDSSPVWTEEDETAFVEELVNVQLEKVASFQAQTLQNLRDRTASCEQRLEEFTGESPVDNPTGNESSAQPASRSQREQAVFAEVAKELDSVTKEMNELEKFSRINYTGFLKATKKHDRKRGESYRVRPLMEVRLAALPFNKEDYSPLLFRLSTMYAFIRQRQEGKGPSVSMSEANQADNEDFTSYKFWVHPDNLLELKTMILRRLPVLVYNPQTSRVTDAIVNDPSITSIYLDNPRFSLYADKAAHSTPASSVRLRWYGDMYEEPEIYCEKKTVMEDDSAHEERFTATKAKYIRRFLGENYLMDKDVQRARELYGAESARVASLAANVQSIHDFVKDNGLQPVLRANYKRSAFQIPGDNRVRITLDTNLAFIREDALDQARPCREPRDWHRRDIDGPGLEYPFSSIRSGEINRFPYAVLEIRIRGHKQYEWTSDIMSSHLVKPAPRFSKFVHGVAVLFDDYVNTFPFWLSEVDTDIRRDPKEAFEAEQERQARAAEDQVAVGSLLRHTPSFKPSPAILAASAGASLHSPIGSPVRSDRGGAKDKEKQASSSPLVDTQQFPRATAQMTRAARAPAIDTSLRADEDDDSSDAATPATPHAPTGKDSSLRGLLPAMSKFARAQRDRVLHGQAKLPPGVVEPSFWIKNEGPLKVEAKVWLANQRTFVKWAHVSILLAGLSLALLNAASASPAGAHVDAPSSNSTTPHGQYTNVPGRILGTVYTLIAVFAALWGYGVYMWRSRLIRARSGRDFDAMLGPVVVCVALIVALVANFALKYQALVQGYENAWGNGSGSHSSSGLRVMHGGGIVGYMVEDL